MVKLVWTPCGTAASSVKNVWIATYLLVPAGVVRRAAQGQHHPWRPYELLFLEHPDACPVLHGDERLHAAQGVAILAPHQVATHHRLWRWQLQ